MKKIYNQFIAILLCCTLIFGSASSVTAATNQISETTVTNGQTFTVFFELNGDTAHGTSIPHTEYVNWISSTPIVVKKGDTVADVIKTILDERGFTYEGFPVYISSITAPDGTTLSETDNWGYSGWMFTVNNEYPDFGMSDCYLNEGDSISFMYTDNFYDVYTQPTISISDTLQAIHINNQKAADVDILIAKIGSVTLQSERSIANARQAYNKLTADQKKLVKNYYLLTNAEKKLMQLKNSVSNTTPKIKLNVSSIPLRVKQSTTCVKLASASIKGDRLISAKSSNSKIATAKIKKGKLVIKGKKKGTAVVTVTSLKGAKTTVKVKVQKKQIKLQKLKLNKKSAIMKKGKTLKLKFTRTPLTADTSIKWSSSNKKVATVSKSGKVRAKKKGTTIITVKAKNGKKAKCKITVK